MAEKISFEDRKQEDVKNIKNKAYEIETKRQTYYLTPKIIKALALKSAFEEIDKSEIVRKALENYIEDEYSFQAEKFLNRK